MTNEELVEGHANVDLETPPATHSTGLNVLSLFDGMSCGRIALQKANISVENYYSSEIKDYAIKVANENYPQDQINRLGDITKIKAKLLCLSEVYSYICNYDSNLQSNIREWEVLYWLDKNFTFSAKIGTQEPNEGQKVSKSSSIQRIEEVWFSNREMGSVRKFGDDTRSGSNGKENDIRTPQQLQCSEWRYDNDVYRRYKEENIGIATRETKNGDSEKKNFGNIEETVFKGKESENYFGENKKSNVEEGCSGELLEREGEDRFSRTVKKEKRNGRAEKNSFIDEIVRELCGWNETDGIAQDYWNILRLHKEEQVTVVEYEGGYHIFKGKIDLLCGGSPCQDFSGANKERLGVEGVKSGLFFEYVRLLKELKPTYFLLENVRMKKEHQDFISSILGFEPIVINSEKVAPHLRHRLYWTNIPNIQQPTDLGLKLNDFLIDGYSDREKARTLLESHSRPLSTPIKMCHRYFNTGFTTLIFKSKEHYDLVKAHFDANFKNKSAIEIDELSKEMDLSLYEGVRYMTNIERESCQTVPNGYTNSLTQNEAACVLGDGWTVDVIAHILSFM